LDNIPNRFVLCRLVSVATRKFLGPDMRVQNVINDVIGRFADTELTLWEVSDLVALWESHEQRRAESLQFDTSAGMMDKVFDMDGLKVFVDATSIMYLNGCRVDYVETLEGAGFKFENPNVKSTCGCGSSFNV
jgi:Iron-sulphur cluster biosynthesis